MSRNADRNQYFIRSKSPIFNAIHECSLSKEFFTKAGRVTRGKSKYNIPQLSTVIDIMRNDPNIDARNLRTLLKDVVPSDLNLDAKFICNFRSRVALHISKFVDGDSSLTSLSAKFLTVNKSLTQEEMSITNNPIIRTNFLSVLRKVMQTGDTTWSAIGYLKQMQIELPGTSYRIKLDCNNIPEAILWMTPQMKLKLIRFGDILFLDAQKRPYNHFGWPYIGVTIKDGWNRVGVCCEGICATEDLEVYEWILKSLCEMVPDFKLSRIKLIFGDQFLKQSLLVKLNIEETCVLRCDYYHCMNEVWPSRNNFGVVVMAKIRQYLEGMLTCRTKAQWENLSNKALKGIENDPRKIGKLLNIVNSVTYYAGFYLRSLEGNLDLLGSTPAEINHASNVAHLGKGASWSISEHCANLFKRQQYLSTKENQQENEYYVSMHK